MSVLHYGGETGGPMLCGAEWNREWVTWRPYELEAGANRRLPYLCDTKPCPDCQLKLVERGELKPTYSPDPTHKAARIAFLERKRLVTIEDAKVKLEGEDWHGVQDCASDLRDIDNEIFGLRF